VFLRSHARRKNGKRHRYFSIVENRRLPEGRSVQRQLLYLGEINDSQQLAWRKSLEVFDEDRREVRTLSLFPDDRELPSDALDIVAVKVHEIELRRPRSFGDCWLGCLLWEQLDLSSFWSRRLHDPRAGVAWEKVLRLLVVNRLIAPGSEFAVHRRWYWHSAMDQLLQTDDSIADKDRLYRCLDRLLRHKDDLCKHLQQKWKTLFDARFDVLLYDLTSTYFEGLCEQIPKAKHGYSRDSRSDCRQIVIALIVTPDGLPLAYEIMPGNTADCTTLRPFLAKIESMYGKADRIWVMDRGIPTQAILHEMRSQGVSYLVGTPRSMLASVAAELAEKEWSNVHDGMRVKLIERGEGADKELFVLARSDDRALKERAMRRRRFKKLVRGLHALRKRCTDGSTRLTEVRDILIARLAVLKKDAGLVARCIDITVPKTDQPINRSTFRYKLNREKFTRMIQRDGAYLLRSNLTCADPQQLWKMYMQLIQIEAAFKTFKSELNLRPIFHFVEPRVEAHVLVAFLGYCLLATLKMRLAPHAPGLSCRSVLEILGQLIMVDVHLPTTDGRELILSRYTQPDAGQQLVLEKLNMILPAQPPPRIHSRQLTPPATEPQTGLW
jgi:transposase